MAFLQSNPTSANPQANYSINSTTSLGMPSTLFSPTDKTGAVIDLTGYNTATFRFTTPGQQTNANTLANGTGTVDSAGATGITLSMTPTNLNTALATMLVTAGTIPYDVLVGNGTDQLIAGKGNLIVSTIG